MAIGKVEQLVKLMMDNMDTYKQNDFFRNLTNLITGSSAKVNLNEHYLQQEVDKEWIEAIEKIIIPLDGIIRSPRRFIKNDEEIVPIALARGITTESIKHLAQHTNMIQSVEDDTVTPSRILEIRKEESYETYENRFLYTLIKKVSYFLDKRMQIVNDTVRDDNEYQVNYNGTFDFNKDKVTYNISFNYESSNKTNVSDLNTLINQNAEDLTYIERIERLRKIFYDFQNSAFCKQMVNAPLIKPPLTITNLLAKNPDYKACVDLWVYLEKYSGTGVVLNVVDRNETPAADVVEKLMQFTALQYVYLKNYTSGLVEETLEDEIPENVLDRKIEQIINSYDFRIDEVRRIFLDKLQKKEQKIFAVEKRFCAIINEAIQDEKDYKLARFYKMKEQKLKLLQAREDEIVRKMAELGTIKKEIDKEKKLLNVSQTIVHKKKLTDLNIMASNEMKKANAKKKSSSKKSSKTKK